MSKEVEVVVASHDGTHVDITYLYSILHTRVNVILTRAFLECTHPPATTHQQMPA